MLRLKFGLYGCWRELLYPLRTYCLLFRGLYDLFDVVALACVFSFRVDSDSAAVSLTVFVPVTTLLSSIGMVRSFAAAVGL